MTPNQISEIAGFLTNSSRISHLEIEIPQRSIRNYILKYETATGGILFPALPNESVYIIPTGGNKWGREMRIYFHHIDDATIPAQLLPLLTVGGRPGYDNYNLRVNNVALLDSLIAFGFVLGSPQNEARIRSLIPNPLLGDFNNGYVI